MRGGWTKMQHFVTGLFFTSHGSKLVEENPFFQFNVGHKKLPGIFLDMKISKGTLTKLKVLMISNSKINLSNESGSL